jgi:hypothetical protein
MSPKKMKKLPENLLELEAIEIDGSEQPIFSTSYDIDPTHQDSIDKYSKQTGGGLMVSLCL